MTDSKAKAEEIAERIVTIILGSYRDRVWRMAFIRVLEALQSYGDSQHDEGIESAAAHVDKYTDHHYLANTIRALKRGDSSAKGA